MKYMWILHLKTHIILHYPKFSCNKIVEEPYYQAVHAVLSLSNKFTCNKQVDNSGESGSKGRASEGNVRLEMRA